MRGAEGRSAVGPGRSSNRAWSEGPKNYIRNVEAEGSSPFTSTKSPGQRLESGIPQDHILVDVTLRDLIGRQEAPMSATGVVVDVVHASSPSSLKTLLGG